MRRTTLFPASLLLAALTWHPALAQTLDLSEVSSSPADEAPAVPPSGMRMTDVERRFGPPLERGQPVGRPPILVWRYAGFRVYFEYDRVLHSVLGKSAENRAVPR